MAWKFNVFSLNEQYLGNLAYISPEMKSWVFEKVAFLAAVSVLIFKYGHANIKHAILSQNICLITTVDLHRKSGLYPGGGALPYQSRRHAPVNRPRFSTRFVTQWPPFSTALHPMTPLFSKFTPNDPLFWLFHPMIMIHLIIFNRSPISKTRNFKQMKLKFALWIKNWSKMGKFW